MVFVVVVTWWFVTEWIKSHLRRRQTDREREIEKKCSTCESITIEKIFGILVSIKAL